MSDILHRIGVADRTPQTVYQALTTVDGLARWWTQDTAGRPDDVGGRIEFRFPPVGGFDMEVVDLQPDERVLWRVVAGPEEWVDTTIDWRLRQDDGWTTVLFGHRGWREPVEFMHHCSTKWGTFLMSLKAFVENGSGAPAPQDVAISDWH